MGWAMYARHLWEKGPQYGLDPETSRKEWVEDVLLAKWERQQGIVTPYNISKKTKFMPDRHWLDPDEGWCTCSRDETCNFALNAHFYNQKMGKRKKVFHIDRETVAR